MLNAAELQTIIAKIQDKQNPLTSLNLAWKYIGDEGIKTLAPYLKDSALTSIDLGDNEIGDEGIKALAPYLKDSALTSIDLSDNEIGDEGIKALALYLKDSALTSINFWRNQIGAEGIKALAPYLKDSALTSINLSINQIGDEGIKALAPYLKDSAITSIDLGGNQIGAEGIKALAPYLKDSAITSIDLGGNQIGDAGIKALAPCLKDSALTSIDLRYNQIGDAGIKALAPYLKDSALTSIGLGGNQIGDAGIKALAPYLKDSAITSIGLGGNQIGDDGIKALAPCLKDSAIRSINLCSNQIGAAGIKALAPYLKDLAIRSINFWRNQIGAEGIKALAPYLKDSALTSIGLGGNQIGAEGIKALAPYLKDSAITSIDLADNHIGDEGIKALAPYLKDSALTSIDLGDNRIGDEGIKALASYLKDSAITSIYLYNNQIGAEGIEALAPYLKDSAITSIDLSINQIGAEGQAQIDVLLAANRQFRDQVFQLFNEQNWPALSAKLLEKSAAIYHTDNQRNNLLHLACATGKLEALQFLVQRMYPKILKRFLQDKNKQGQTPLDVAKQHGHATFLSILSGDLTVALVNIEAILKQVAPKPPKPPTIVPTAATTSGSSQLAKPTSVVATTSGSSQATKSALPSFQTIAWQELQIGKLIDGGTYGDVYSGQWHGISVAVKQLHLKTLTVNLKKEFADEVNIMSQCHFPHIISLFGVCLENGHYAIIMEHMSKGSLHQILHNDNELFAWQPTRWQIALDIARGVSYLHSKDILHRDLKSLNILLDMHYRAKIADFGLAKIKNETASTTLGSKKNTTGTVRWRAPELFQFKAKPTSASDVYSMGLVLWEIASRQLPYSYSSDDATVIDWIKQGAKEDIPVDCPAPFSDIIQQCWSHNPNARPSASAAAAAIQQGWASVPTESKSWHFDPDLKQQTKLSPHESYRLIPASETDIANVLAHYRHHPATGMDIKSVQVIYNPSLNRSFALRLKLLQERAAQAAFNPRWPQENHSAWRSRIDSTWKSLASPYTDPEFPEVKLLPMWHGTNPAILDSLFKTGYANLATTDVGYFGKGIYSAHEAEYAYRVYSKGALVLNWVASYSAYPTVYEDMSKFAGGSNYQNYDAHLVPVVPKDQNLNQFVYYPTHPKQQHEYTEFVVFESTQCLPRYYVELQPALPKTVKLLEANLSLFKPATKLPVTELLLANAAQYVYNTYLLKPYTLQTYLADWNYSNHDMTINRPNHGLAHTLRTLFYAPFVVKYFLATNKDQLSVSKQQDIASSVPYIQLALLFFVVGRENEMGSHNDPTAYSRFRQQSAAAFSNYVRDNNIQIPTTTLKLLKAAILESSFNISPLHTILKISHDIDTLRCVNPTIYRAILQPITPYVGNAGAAALQQLVLNCLIATGDRIMGDAAMQRDYQGDLFVESNISVTKCLEHVSEAVKQWQQKVNLPMLPI